MMRSGSHNYENVYSDDKDYVRDMVLGIGIGVASSLALSSIMANLLYGVAPTDPVAFLLMAPVLMIIALLAAFMPVRRALAVHPTETLRHE